MGHSKAEKEASHRRILEIAARRFREHGFDGVALIDLMHGAGLTHGGFYKHFATRDGLVAEATSQAFAEGKVRLSHDLAKASSKGLEGFLEVYLSKRHRNDVGTSCPVAALATDVARVPSARPVFEAAFKTYADWVGGMLDGPPDGRRARGAAVLCAVAGAIAISRALDDETLSSGVLQAARNLVWRAEGAKSDRRRRRPRGRSTAGAGARRQKL